mmetsp:Transcript_10947/g.21232  ORF Transcript_10947/g.21232 Transcript_10947/m.21232 type:complete len:83 (-) Transcript_10947:158-406(-)|eukprot:CAMPEP_0196726454 /NCGR_PEP_ID=MMETSP1091-20130531/7730_1 /TAXON_ID=302021 /ORGANISM="Rhodomonas sp., Strain CCMP768" /LENGTH=82 /DNA_ID=CAMNT_0042068901 /DNA_START=34 /DNA_END=282 /DNA_ORIENTATION=+
MLSLLGMRPNIVVVPAGSLAYEWNHDPYYYRMDGAPGDPESIFNQFEPAPPTLVFSTDPYNYRMPGPPGDPESIYNQFEMNW